MEQTILTPNQSLVLEHAAKDPKITDRYYLTGGTALAEFYLRHRISEDIDFFSEHNVNPLETNSFVESLKAVLPIKNISLKPISGLFIYTIAFTDGNVLKIDFNDYDVIPVESSNLKIGNLRIDSLYDIAINKVASIMGRSKARDFIDLYFCIKKEGYTWEQLFGRVEDKFGVSYEETTVVTQFAHVQDVQDYPTMLVPFNKEDMINFYLSEAKKLEPKIFK